ncbi:hypothetical protein NL53_06355 [Vibrio variabilis]|uniref:MSHA pilin protein MshA n=1 Tax=Vibrio variabilis TaxID=990271 RepID=A0ABR4YD31_9VIBR|nr:type II secretion system protein [Vibrio variabilis]KHA61256.1 hypothetical protein NL53_06355 [Vibrio variabilis]
MKRYQFKGFTLIELVIVIAILAIVSVFALPRFLNVQQDAHDNRAQAAFAAFINASQMYHSVWLVENEPSSAAVTGYGDGNIFPSTSGYPRNVNSFNPSKPDCPELWENLLQTDLSVDVHSDPILINNADADVVSWYRANGACYYYYKSNIHDYTTNVWALEYQPLDGTFQVSHDRPLPQ